jgi:DNA-binding response OmpR family regulator
MSVTVVLAIGFDPWLLESQRAVWRSSGHFVTPAGSLGEAIDQFRDGDFDAVLLGEALSAEGRERVISSILGSGSRVPVLCVTEPSSECKTCEFGANGDPTVLMRRIREMLVAPRKKPAVSVAVASADDRAPAFRGPFAMEKSRSAVRRRVLRASRLEAELEGLSGGGVKDNAGLTVCYRDARVSALRMGAGMETGTGPSTRRAS